ncbi:hypothetical protein GCM10027073_30870 [Streptomyces chlorus]
MDTRDMSTRRRGPAGAFAAGAVAAATIAGGLGLSSVPAAAHTRDHRPALGIENCTATACHFDLPPGTYDVRVRLGGEAASRTAIGGETRRTLLAETPAGAGQRVTRGFTVDVRTPEGEPTGPDGSPGLDLTLGGSAPALADIRVTPAAHTTRPPTRRPTGPTSRPWWRACGPRAANRSS